jgi:hypothetical protein
MVATGVQAADPSAQPMIAIKKKPAPIALSSVRLRRQGTGH